MSCGRHAIPEMYEQGLLLSTKIKILLQLIAVAGTFTTVNLCAYVGVKGTDRNRHFRATPPQKVPLYPK